uniref:HECT-type E3 ubiquitin transferase n=1 Tax=Glossina brevipalpis TaxID=37001 RepID=A0A1A9WIM5_9MUSC
MAPSKKELSRGRLVVVLESEQGMDYGGLTKEFFQLSFTPCLGLIEYSATNIHTIQHLPAFVDNLKNWFQFLGRVFGLALIDRCLQHASCVAHFYKTLFRLPMTLSDLESLDDEFFQSLEWIRDRSQNFSRNWNEELQINF